MPHQRASAEAEAARFTTYEPLLDPQDPHRLMAAGAKGGSSRPPAGGDGGGGGTSGGGAAADASTMLADVAHQTTETEFFSPMPQGYRKGLHKYVVVLGTVMSGLGKGIFASSVAKLLKDKGLCVAPIKLEGYLNIDAGTLNPFRHGEVFVLDDGTECDMDLGTYERLLDQDVTRRNFTTSGQVFSTIVERERRGAYLGRDVQWIPHVTGEVKRRIRELALQGDGNRPADVVFIEVGGTVGDYENGFYIEALRELAFEEGPDSVCFVALTYVIKPQSLGEQKSKAAQLGIKRLMEAGVQPHVIACRAEEEVSAQVREKIAMFSNVPMRRVFSMHDRPSVYSIPEDMRFAGLDREILSVLDLHDRTHQSAEDRNRKEWTGFVDMVTRPKQRKVSIALAGKYVSTSDAYASIDKAVEHVGAHLNCDVDLSWIETTNLTRASAAEALAEVDGVIVPGGFGSRGVEGKIACAQFCRESRLPYLGICLGFQVAVIEFARNVCGLADANSTEFRPACAHPVISELPEQKKIEGLGGTMRLGGQEVEIRAGTLAEFLYMPKSGVGKSAGLARGRVDPPSAGATSRLTIRERFRHRYEVDPRYIDRLEAAGLVFSGKHPKQPIMQMLELPVSASAGAGESGVAHPFFLAAQFHPELTGRPLRPQPMFMGLIAAALRRKYAEDEAVMRDAAIGQWTRGEAKKATTTTQAV